MENEKKVYKKDNADVAEVAERWGLFSFVQTTNKVFLFFKNEWLNVRRFEKESI